MLKVGNIVYLLDKKTHAVVPCKIVEKIQSIKEAGETVSHVVQSPNGKTLTLEDYKSPWFESLDGARDFLIDAATSLIDTTLETTKAKEASTFAPTAQESEAVSPEGLPIENSVTYIELENGQKAKISLPDGM